jgi:hypothetical protein
MADTERPSRAGPNQVGDTRQVLKRAGGIGACRSKLSIDAPARCLARRRQARRWLDVPAMLGPRCSTMSCKRSKLMSCARHRRSDKRRLPIDLREVRDQAESR